MTEKAKQRIQELVPEVKGVCGEHDYHHVGCVSCNINRKTITLTIVLRAIEKVAKGTSYFVDTQGDFHEWFAPKGRLDLRTVTYWNLAKDNYDDQSDETKRFIGMLLGVEDVVGAPAEQIFTI